ncbi:MAG: hypothetical protein WC457_01920 [Patescibacteria group bacterium]
MNEASFHPDTPTEEGEPEQFEPKVEVLPAIKDLKNIWRDLFTACKDTNEAESFFHHVQIMEFNDKDKTRHFLILTDVKPEKEEEYKNIFGAKKDPINVDLFLVSANRAKAVSKLPDSFDADVSNVYEILS